MLDPLQQAYLDALGVQVWVRRGNGAQSAPAAEAVVPVAEAVPRPAAEPSTQPAAEPAAAAAPAIPADWDGLAAAVAGCTACPLHQSRTQTVFGVGNRNADWLVIGEAPGAEEDRRGEPFVGRAGQLLDAMLRAVGLDRNQAYIANILKCRPPNNRDPRPEEVEACAGFLNRQIELIRPRLILAVGRIAAQNLLHSDAPIGRLRGRVHRLEPEGIPVVVTYHPAYLLRSPGEKRKAWADLLLARSLVEETTP